MADTLFGIPLKFIALSTLILQNSALVLLMRYSRTMPGPAYLPSTAVVMAESIKLVISLVIHIINERRTRRMGVIELWNDIFGAGSGWVRHNSLT